MNNISRQSIYLMALSIFLFLFVLLFSFLVLIPEGKEYREQRSKLNKQRTELRRYQKFSDTTLQKLKELQSKNGRIITAFDTSFNSMRFEKLNRTYFSSLKLSKKQKTDEDDGFEVYEVNTTSSINSPQSFYDFLDAVNEGHWIIGINFPINFKRDAEMITSSFTMKVYSVGEISKGLQSSE